MTSPAPSTSSWLPWVQPSVQAMGVPGSVVSELVTHRKTCYSFPEGGLAMLYLLGQEGHLPSGYVVDHSCCHSSKGKAPFEL